MTYVPKVGDVVYCEGTSAILGDVISVDEEDEYAEVIWRRTHTGERFVDLIQATQEEEARLVALNVSEREP